MLNNNFSEHRKFNDDEDTSCQIKLFPSRNLSVTPQEKRRVKLSHLYCSQPVPLSAFNNLDNASEVRNHCARSKIMFPAFSSTRTHAADSVQ